MDKDKTIKELNEMNRLLARELDEKDKYIQELEQDSNKLASDIRGMCTRDIITKEINIEQNDSTNSNHRLILSKPFGNPNALEDNKNHEFARKHTLVHLKSNSVCTWIPKNSCSSLRYSIAFSNGAIGGTEDIEWIHKNNASFRATNKELLNAEYAFVVLRNPFKRLLSFYCDKICHKGANENDTSYETAKSVIGTTEDTSFAQFIDILWRNPALKKRNGHIQDQCDFLIYKKYSDYLSVENYEETYSTIRQKIGVTLKDVRPLNSIYTTLGCQDSHELDYDTPAELISSALAEQQKPITKNMYNTDLIKKVGALYLCDILLYLREIDKGENEMRYWLQYMT